MLRRAQQPNIEAPCETVFSHNVVDDASQAIVASNVSLPAAAKPFASSLLQAGKTFSHRFDVPGTCRYICTLHELNGMKGAIVVRPAAPVRTVLRASNCAR